MGGGRRVLGSPHGLGPLGLIREVPSASGTLPTLMGSGGLCFVLFCFVT